MEMLSLSPKRTYGTIAGTGFMPSPTRSYQVHEVRPEDTLAGLALKYDVTVEEIRRTNSLWANDNVWPGQVLRVPVAATQVAAAYQEDTASSASTTTSTSSLTSGTTSSSSPRRRTDHGGGPVLKDTPSSSAVAAKQAASAATADPTLEEYLSRLDRSIAERKEATKDFDRRQQMQHQQSDSCHNSSRESIKKTPTSRKTKVKSNAERSSEPPIC